MAGQAGTASPMAGLADLLEKLGVKTGDGWAGVDPTSEDNAAQREQQALERFQRAKVIADAFADQKGQRALLALREQTIELPSWKPDELGFLNAIGFGMYREGQNQLIRFIERCIEIAAQGPQGTEPVPASRKRGKR